MPLGNVNLTPQLVQAVRDAVDIVSIASEHTRLVKAGRRYSGLCPIHKEKSPSFSVDPVQGLFYCFGCGAGGDAIKLHMLTTGDDFPAAIEALAMRYGIPLPSRTEARFAGGKPEQDLEGALKAAADFFADQLRKSAFALQYLERRRIPPELIERFGLGYAPDGFQNLVKALHPRISKADLEAAGLIAKSERSGDHYDRFRHRLMFPIHNSSGRLVGFGGRTLGDDKAKYINTNETDRFHKGLLLYGLHLAKREIRETNRAVLVEGYFDVIGSVACGLEGAVAGMGTALTPEQAKLLSRYAEEVVVAYDGDNAGENAFRRALPLLLSDSLAVRRARFPGTHDPDSLRLEQGEEAVRTAIGAAEDAVVAELDRAIPAGTAKEPQLQAKAATAVTELLRPIPDAILRFSYARIAADRLGIPVEMLSRRIGGGVRPEAGSLPGGSASSSATTLVRPAGGDDGGPRTVRSLEEQVIAVLLQTEDTAAIPPRDQLPPAEVFFDTECRNIYEAFCALYTEAGSPPNAHRVRSRLGEAEGIVVRFARIMVEGSFASGRNGLQESLDTLTGRWFRQRRQEVQREIGDAQRRGDEALLSRLLEERDRLNRSLHRGSRPGVNPGLG
ncbi:MAG TPA: DNA primase [Thermoanaerobaculia bacterium]|jgi:DNA primase|nr:DNA primase [Thermoanaerobaculia bacterium]